MADQDPFQDLPSDPEEAFLLLERHFREECENRIHHAHQDERIDIIHMDYIAQVLAAVSELGLQAAFNDHVPNIGEVDYATYLNFSKDVKHYRTMLEIRHARRAQGNSVRLNAATKEKLRHYLGQIKAIVDDLDVNQVKKNALYHRISDLELEVNRDRTRFESVGALCIEASGVLGEAIEKSKILPLLNAVARVLWGAKEEERLALPAPKVIARIEGPAKKTSSPKKPVSELDDEIPF